MKEITTISKDQVQNVKQVAVKKHRERIGSILPGDGHTCYEFNKKIFEVRKAKFKLNKDYDMTKKGSSNRLVDVQENCFYICSLNIENAVRKIQKIFKAVPYIIEIVE